MQHAVLSTVLLPVNLIISYVMSLKPTPAHGMQEATAFALTDLSSGIFRTWLVMTARHFKTEAPLLNNMPTAVLQSVQPILDLAVTVVQAYPGPGLTENRRNIPAVQGPRRPAAELAAAEASHGGPISVSKPQEEGTASLHYKCTALVQAASVAVTLELALIATWSESYMTDDPLSLAFLKPRLPPALLGIVTSPSAQKLTLALLVTNMSKLAYSKKLETVTFAELEAAKARQQRSGSSCLVEFSAAHEQAYPHYKQLAEALGPLGQAALFTGCSNMACMPTAPLLALGCHCTAKAMLEARNYAHAGGPSKQAELLPRHIVKPLVMGTDRDVSTGE